MNNSTTTDLDSRSRSREFLFVAACFLVSGFAALLYETVWLRQFAILLGTSEQALAVVLASYLGGLAIGSLVACRVVNSVQRPLLIYGVLEFGIALTALFVPYGLTLANSIQASVLGGNPEPLEAGGLVQVMFCFSTAFALILLPTGLMGATLPLLTRHVVASDQELGPRIGLLYAINTAGAVVGTMVAAFLLLPALGLGRTTWVGVASNFLVFLIVLAMVRVRGNTLRQSESIHPTEKGGESPGEQSRTVTGTNKLSAGNNKQGKNHRGKKQRESKSRPKPLVTHQSSGTVDGRYRWILVMAAVSGAVSFCYEIVFTRMLGQMLGGSVFAFATMLSGFLLGIALGGAIASRLTASRSIAAKWFVYAQAGAGICTLFTYGLVNEMVVWSWDSLGESSETTVQVLASIIALLPTSTLIGATFPLAIRIYAKDESDAARGAARVYYWNVLGGIAGAMATGIWILPNLQYEGTTAFAVLVNILIAVAVVLVLKVKPVHLAMPAIAFAILVLRFPVEPENVLRISALTGKLAPGEIIFNHVGRSATVTILKNRGEIIFQTNGLPESQLQMLGSADIYRYSGYWLSALPPLVRPQCKSMLIIGLGGGMVAELVPPSIESIDVLEIEPSVVEANRRIAGERNFDPLSDPRVNLILNDGRNALALTDKKYDAIVSQPSHPWTAGASHLYSREFDELVRDHLNPGGIFLQWMDSEFVDVGLTKSMGATILDVFPHARLYQPGPGVFMFVASDQAIRPEENSTDRFGMTVCDVNEGDREIFQRLGVVTPTHLFSILTLEENELRRISKGAELITDERNLLAMRAPFVTDEENMTVVESYLEGHTPIRRGLDTARSLCPSFDLKSFLLRKANRQNADWIRETGLRLMEDPSQRATVESKLQQLSKSTDQWLAEVRKLAREFPDNSDLAFEMISNKILGTKVELPTDEEAALRRGLNAQHQMVIRLLEQLMENDWVSARALDAELARWPVDDVAYEIAVRLRLPWRLEAPAMERVFRCEEAIGIIDRSAPFSNGSGLAFFRVAAAIKANRPYVAIATTVTLARLMQRSIDEEDASSFTAGASNLARCYSVLQDRSLFQTVPAERYNEALAEVQGVMAGVRRR